MRQKFDIKYRPQIESGEYKVETATGKQVRIICWDKKSDMNKKKIVALLDDGNFEHVEYYTEQGTVYEKAPTGGDLFLITPEPEPSEFEQEICTISNLCLNLEMVDEIKRAAAELLAIARKELEPEFEAEIEKAYKNADEVMYRKGKEDALKDLPRWRFGFNVCEVEGEDRSHPEISYYDSERKQLVCVPTDKYTAKVLLLKELKKLPGFKEDSHE